MKLTSRFKVLLAEKEIREGRSYTLRDVAGATGASIYAITGFANNSLKEIPVDALTNVCDFLGCTAGDLLVYRPNDKTTMRAA